MPETPETSEMPETPESPERRRLLRSFAAAAGGLVAVLFGLPGLSTLLAPVRRAREGGWQAVAEAADLEPGVPQAFTYPLRAGWEVRREKGFLLREEDGILALSARCTHLGCLVRPRGEGFSCACHGGVFSREGEPLKGPVTEPLKRFETRITDGRVEIRSPS